VTIKDAPYEKLYVGRFKGDSSALLQFGKKGEKQILAVSNPRKKARKPGSAWKETYQNEGYKINMNARPTSQKVKGKFTYFIDVNFTDRSRKKTIKNIALANCKS